ncbi:hypothetical protein GQ457_02G042540 [Hibiscus cannabinus]
MLQRYRSDPTHVMPVEEIELYPDLSYDEEPVEILTLDSKIASVGKARRQGGSNITFVQDLACCSPEFCISGVEYRYPISGIGTQIQHWNLGLNFYIWMIIKYGHVEASKKKKKMSIKDTKKDQLNAKAMYIILCALDKEASKKVSSSKSAEEIWEKLEKFYGKEEKTYEVPSSANFLSSSKVDGVMAHEECHDHE